MVFEIGGKGRRLVRGRGEDVGETAAGVDYGFGGFFGLGYTGAGLDLGGTDGGDVGTGTGERRIEHSGCAFERMLAKELSLGEQKRYRCCIRRLRDRCTGRRFLRLRSRLTSTER